MTAPRGSAGLGTAGRAAHGTARHVSIGRVGAGKTSQRPTSHGGISSGAAGKTSQVVACEGKAGVAWERHSRSVGTSNDVTWRDEAGADSQLPSRQVAVRQAGNGTARFDGIRRDRDWSPPTWTGEAGAIRSGTAQHSISALDMFSRGVAGEVLHGTSGYGNKTPGTPGNAGSRGMARWRKYPAGQRLAGKTRPGTDARDIAASGKAGEELPRLTRHGEVPIGNAGEADGRPDCLGMDRMDVQDTAGNARR